MFIKWQSHITHNFPLTSLGLFQNKLLKSFVIIMQISCCWSHATYSMFMMSERATRWWEVLCKSPCCDVTIREKFKWRMIPDTIFFTELVFFQTWSVYRSSSDPNRNTRHAKRWYCTMCPLLYGECSYCILCSLLVKGAIFFHLVYILFNCLFVVVWVCFWSVVFFQFLKKISFIKLN